MKLVIVTQLEDLKEEAPELYVLYLKPNQSYVYNKSYGKL